MTWVPVKVKIVPYGSIINSRFDIFQEKVPVVNWDKLDSASFEVLQVVLLGIVQLELLNNLADTSFTFVQLTKVEKVIVVSLSTELLSGNNRVSD